MARSRIQLKSHGRSRTYPPCTHQQAVPLCLLPGQDTPTYMHGEWHSQPGQYVSCPCKRFMVYVHKVTWPTMEWWGRCTSQTAIYIHGGDRETGENPISLNTITRDVNLHTQCQMMVWRLCTRKRPEGWLHWVEWAWLESDKQTQIDNNLSFDQSDSRLKFTNQMAPFRCRDYKTFNC